MPQDSSSTAPVPSSALQPPSTSTPSATTPAALASATAATLLGGVASAGSTTVSRPAVDEAPSAVPPTAPAKDSGTSFFSATGFSTSAGASAANAAGAADVPRGPRMKNVKRLAKKSSGDSSAASPGLSNNAAWDKVLSVPESEAAERARLVEKARTVSMMKTIASRTPPHVEPATIDLFEEMVSTAVSVVMAEAAASPSPTSSPSPPFTSFDPVWATRVRPSADWGRRATGRRGESFSDADVHAALDELTEVYKTLIETDQQADSSIPTSLSVAADVDLFAGTPLNPRLALADLSAEAGPSSWVVLDLCWALCLRSLGRRISRPVEGSVSSLKAMSRVAVCLARTLITLAARLRDSSVAARVSSDTDVGQQFLWALEAAIDMTSEYWFCFAALSFSERHYKLLKTRFDKAFRNSKALEEKEVAWSWEKRFYQVEGRGCGQSCPSSGRRRLLLSVRLSKLIPGGHKYRARAPRTFD